MSAIFLDSGCLVMAAADRVRRQHGNLQVKFCDNDEPDTQADFVVSVPFGMSVGVVSTDSQQIVKDDASYRLLVTTTGAGARGEIASIVYSLSQVS